MATKNVKQAKKEDAYVSYKIVAALFLLIGVIYGFQKIGQYYSTAGGFETVYIASKLCTVIFAALCAAAFIVYFLLKHNLVRAICRYVFCLSALMAISGLLLRLYWTEYLYIIYFLHAAVYCLYIIYLLYHTEFTLFSLCTAMAGALFYLYSKGFGMNLRSIVPAVVLLICLLGTTLVSFLASKNKGALIFGKKRYPIFHKKFTPMLLYVICALWFVCLIACLILGPAFAYYCMFAAIAVELIAAVYYTFQLK